MANVIPLCAVICHICRYDPVAGHYGKGEQTAQILALELDAPPTPEIKEKVIKRTVDISTYARIVFPSARLTMTLFLFMILMEVFMGIVLALPHCVTITKCACFSGSGESYQQHCVGPRQSHH